MTTLPQPVKLTLLALLLCLGSFSSAFSQAVALKTIGASYSQNFNALPRFTSWMEYLGSTSRSWKNEETLAGWSAQVGTSAASAIDISTGSTSGGLKSLGISSGAEDRSLGGFATSAAGVAYSARFQNATGKSLTQLELNLDMQQWYDGAGVSSLSLDYRVIDKTGNAGAWVSVAALRAPITANNNHALDGTSTTNKVAVTRNLGAFVLAPGEELVLRWAEAAGAGKDLLAIDNFRLMTTEVKAPVTKVFYSNAWLGGELSQLNAWNTDRFFASGDAPVSFTAPNQIFVVQPSLLWAPVLTKNLLLPVSSKLVIGTGSAIIFTIPENVTVSAGSLDISALALVTIASDNVPDLGNVDPTSTVIYSALGAQSVKIGEYGNLQIDGANGKSKKLNQKILVRGQLELKNGVKLEAGDFDIVLQDNKKPVKFDENSFVVVNGKGRLKMRLAPGDSAVFPVGVKKAMPVKIKLNTGSVADTFSVKMVEGLYTAYENNVATGLPLDSKVVQKTWIIDEQKPGGSEVEMTFEWKAEEMSADFTADSAYLLHYHNNAWDKGTAAKITKTGNIYSVTRKGITSFSPFGVAAVNSAIGSTNPNPLPVELLYFQAKRTSQQVQFTWETASEKDNDFFTLEQSVDGKNFMTVGQPVKGAGTSNVRNKYTYALADQTVATLYFRLKQTDYDGTFEYSKTIAVKGASETAKIALQVTVFPNPTQDGKVQLITNQASDAVSMTVYDQTGKVILQKESVLAQGLPTDLDLSAQAPGLYLIQLQNSASKETLRLLKK